MLPQTTYSTGTAVSGAGTVPILLRGYSYKTYGVFPSDSYFRGTTPSYDYSFPAVFPYLFADPGLLQSRQNPVTGYRTHMSGAEVDDGVIVGGIDAGEPLFPSGAEERGAQREKHPAVGFRVIPACPGADPKFPPTFTQPNLRTGSRR